jgi:hypothetical protein
MRALERSGPYVKAVGLRYDREHDCRGEVDLAQIDHGGKHAADHHADQDAERDEGSEKEASHCGSPSRERCARQSLAAARALRPQNATA